MKVTQRAKSVDVMVEEFMEIRRISSYVCPSCRVGYKGIGPSKNVTRFVCECGQELIVRKRIVDRLHEIPDGKLDSGE